MMIMLLIVLFQKQTELSSIYLKKGSYSPTNPPALRLLRHRRHPCATDCSPPTATAAATRQLNRKKKQRIVRGSRCSATCSGKRANLSCDCVCSAISGGRWRVDLCGQSLVRTLPICPRGPGHGARCGYTTLASKLSVERDEDREIEKILNRWPPYLQGRWSCKG